MSRKFEYRKTYNSEPEKIELISINMFPNDVYKIIFIDKYNELVEEKISSLSALRPISA